MPRSNDELLSDALADALTYLKGEGMFHWFESHLGLNQDEVVELAELVAGIESTMKETSFLIGVICGWQFHVARLADDVISGTE